MDLKDIVSLVEKEYFEFIHLILSAHCFGFTGHGLHRLIFTFSHSRLMFSDLQPLKWMLVYVFCCWAWLTYFRLSLQIIYWTAAHRHWCHPLLFFYTQLDFIHCEAKTSTDSFPALLWSSPVSASSLDHLTPGYVLGLFLSVSPDITLTSVAKYLTKMLSTS